MRVVRLCLCVRSLARSICGRCNAVADRPSIHLRAQPWNPPGGPANISCVPRLARRELRTSARTSGEMPIELAQLQRASKPPSPRPCLFQPEFSAGWSESTAGSAG